MTGENNGEAVRLLTERIKKLEAANKKTIKQYSVVRRALDQLAHDVSVKFSQPNEKTGRSETEQEAFWSGVNGTSYSIDNYSDDIPNSEKIALWKTIFDQIDGVEDALEVGCNIGLNLRAIHEFKPDLELSAIEINARAANIVEQLGYVHMYRGSVFDFEQPKKWDLVYVRGVLMHLHTDFLQKAYTVINNHARKYVCFCENFSEQVEVIPYRGRNDLLVSRHFAREFTSAFPRWKIVADGWDSIDTIAPSNRDRRWFVMKNIE
jgi:spore coat polysaccharide biosynthesis protein SpsF